MCTAATYKTKDFYMGRTLDYEFSYGDEVTVTPRNYPINFRFMGVRNNHYAMIGMAHVADDYPLYYEAFNEKGLGMAGLNFVGNAAYNEPDLRGLNGESNIENVAVFEFIPWILSQCATVDEAKERLKFINLTNTQFNEMFPCANLHWIIADKESCVIVGRNADYILREFDHCLRVFVHADRTWRLLHMRKLMPDTPFDQMEVDMDKADRARKNYCVKHTGRVYGDSRNYDLTLCTSKLGIDKALEILLCAAKDI